MDLKNEPVTLILDHLICTHPMFAVWLIYIFSLSYTWERALEQLVRLLFCDIKVTGLSRGNSLLQKG